MMPLPVLEQAQKELLDYKGSGMSMLEISHRNKLFEEVNDQAQEHIKRLLGMDDSWVVMFMGGGASPAVFHGSHELFDARGRWRLMPLPVPSLKRPSRKPTR
jgi:phosphoserine aminotransferase